LSLRGARGRGIRGESLQGGEPAALGAATVSDHVARDAQQPGQGGVTFGPVPGASAEGAREHLGGQILGGRDTDAASHVARHCVDVALVQARERSRLLERVAHDRGI
jgi:hypothetical protein